MDIGDLLELQAALQADAAVYVAADKEGVADMVVLLGIITDLGEILFGQAQGDLLVQGHKLREDGVVLRLGHSVQQAGDVQGQQIDDRQLGGEGLGGGHGNLGAGPGVDDVVRLLGDGGAHHVHNGQGAGAPLFGLDEGSLGVGGLAGLADDQHQGVAA